MKNANTRYELKLDELDMVVGGAGAGRANPPGNESVSAVHGWSGGLYVGLGANVLGNGPSSVMTLGTDGVHFYNIDSKGIGNGASATVLLGGWVANSPNGSAFWGGPGSAASIGVKDVGAASLDVASNASGMGFGFEVGAGGSVGGVAGSLSRTFGTEVFPFGHAEAPSPSGSLADHPVFSDIGGATDASHAGDAGPAGLPAGLRSEFGLSPAGEPLGLDHSNGANPFDPPAVHGSGSGASDTGDGHAASDGGAHTDAGTGAASIATTDSSGHTDDSASHIDNSASHVDNSASHIDDSASPSVDVAASSFVPLQIAVPPPLVETPPPVPEPAPTVVASADPVPIPVSVPANPVDTSPSGDPSGGIDAGGAFAGGGFDDGSDDA